MERFSSISMAVIRRLPKYHRYLGELKKNDIKRVSSQAVSYTHLDVYKRQFGSSLGGKKNDGRRDERTSEYL